MFLLSNFLIHKKNKTNKKKINKIKIKNKNTPRFYNNFKCQSACFSFPTWMLHDCCWCCFNCFFLYLFLQRSQQQPKQQQRTKWSLANCNKQAKHYYWTKHKTDMTTYCNGCGCYNNNKNVTYTYKQHNNLKNVHIVETTTSAYIWSAYHQTIFLRYRKKIHNITQQKTNICHSPLSKLLLFRACVCVCSTDCVELYL